MFTTKSISFIFVLIAFLLVISGCEQIESLLGNQKKGPEGKMVKSAVKDFFRFAAPEHMGNSGTLKKNTKDVWKVVNLSTKKRKRALAEVDASIKLDENILKSRGHKLGYYLMTKTGAKIIRLRFWTRGFRKEGGVFAELMISKDGLNWKGKKRGQTKYFRYRPSHRNWKKLNKKELKTIKEFSRFRNKANNMGVDKPKNWALRQTAAKQNLSPVKINQLLKRIKGMFHQPAKRY